jgi:N6-L-threonylcarbamoyladenine synthase
MRVLGLETSCDETSAAVVRRDGGTLTLEGLAILSQDVHRIFGGVVPELASRAHLVAIDAVVDDALAQAHAGVADIDGIAVTRGPGLLGALLVGVMWAKTVAWRERLPLLGVHHLEGHLFAPTLEFPEVQPPFTALLVSGGHTLLLDVPAWGEYQLLGQTRDDAAGEAFDKVGSLLGLEYPAGAAMERLAADGDPARFNFPRPLLRTNPADADRYAFSFSGLKTAALRAVQQSPDLARDRADIARGFQDAAIDVMVAKTSLAARSFGRGLVVIGGGVACNFALARAMREALAPPARVAVASPRLNTDNAAMIAAAGSWRLMRGEHDGPDLEARDTLLLPGLQHSAGAIA